VLYSEYLKYIRDELGSGESTGLVDPILGKPLNAEDIKLMSPEDALKYIQKFNNVKDESETSGAGDSGAKDGTRPSGGNAAGGDKANENDTENDRVSRRRKARASDKRRGGHNKDK